jgi:hypothetical protein
MKLAPLNHDRLVAQLNRNDLAQFDYLRSRSVLQIGRYRIFFELCIRSLGQHFREIFDLIIGQTDTAVRRERTYLR